VLASIIEYFTQAYDLRHHVARSQHHIDSAATVTPCSGVRTAVISTQTRSQTLACIGAQTWEAPVRGPQCSNTVPPLTQGLCSPPTIELGTALAPACPTALMHGTRDARCQRARAQPRGRSARGRSAQGCRPARAAAPAARAARRACAAARLACACRVSVGYIARLWGGRARGRPRHMCIAPGGAACRHALPHQNKDVAHSKTPEPS